MTRNIKELKEILDKMQINYNTFNDDATPYNKAFMEKMDESIKEGQDGKISFIKTEDL
ncbi:MAG: DUF2683 family protein [Saprospiraceae bacterium]